MPPFFYISISNFPLEGNIAFYYQIVKSLLLSKNMYNEIINEEGVYEFLILAGGFADSCCE